MKRRSTRWAERVIPAAAVILLLLLAAGCRRSAGGVPLDNGTPGATGIRIELVADPADPVIGPARWRITLLDADGAPVEGAVVSLRGDMTHAGMVPEEAAAVEDGAGVYRAEFEWTMAGDWIVTVTATLPDGRAATETFAYNVASGR